MTPWIRKYANLFVARTFFEGGRTGEFAVGRSDCAGGIRWNWCGGRCRLIRLIWQVWVGAVAAGWGSENDAGARAGDFADAVNGLQKSCESWAQGRFRARETFCWRISGRAARRCLPGWRRKAFCCAIEAKRLRRGCTDWNWNAARDGAFGARHYSIVGEALDETRGKDPPKDGGDGYSIAD